MMKKMVWKGVKEFTTAMYLLADNMGLIDIESIYSDKMKEICGRSDLPTKTALFAPKNLKKLTPDIKETEEAIIAAVELPGVEKNDINIAATDDELYVSAKRSEEPKEISERHYSLFCTKVNLPCGIKREEVKASFNNGLLIITLPKEVVTPRTKISIE